MKKLLGYALVMLFMSSAYGYDTAKLRVKVTGPLKNNSYFLCVSHTGCHSMMYGAAKGKVYPIDVGAIENIFTVNITNMQMHTQPLPASCRVAVEKDQTLTVKGTLTKGKNNKMYISNLNCSVA